MKWDAFQNHARGIKFTAVRMFLVVCVFLVLFVFSRGCQQSEFVTTVWVVKTSDRCPSTQRGSFGRCGLAETPKKTRSQGQNVSKLEKHPAAFGMVQFNVIGPHMGVDQYSLRPSNVLVSKHIIILVVFLNGHPMYHGPFDQPSHHQPSQPESGGEESKPLQGPRNRLT